MSTKPFGAVVRSKREASGMTIPEMRDALRDRLPARYVPSVSTLSRWETGQTTDKRVDGVVIVALAEVLRCKVRDLSPSVAEELDSLRDLLRRSPACVTAGDPDQLDLFALVAA